MSHRHRHQDIPSGKAKIMRQGKNIALLAFGPMLHSALDIAEHLDATVVDIRFVKPLDTDCLDLLAKTHAVGHLGGQRHRRRRWLYRIGILSQHRSIQAHTFNRLPRLLHRPRHTGPSL